MTKILKGGKDFDLKKELPKKIGSDERWKLLDVVSDYVGSLESHVKSIQSVLGDEIEITGINIQEFSSQLELVEELNPDFVLIQNTLNAEGKDIAVEIRKVLSNSQVCMPELATEDNTVVEVDGVDYTTVRLIGLKELNEFLVNGAKRINEVSQNKE